MRTETRFDDRLFDASLQFNQLRRRPLEWLVLTGNRLVVSGVLLAVVSAAIWAAVLSGLAPLSEGTPIMYLLFALISGNFALITIVVSISQFVLARHLESPGEIREKIRDMFEYREEVVESTRQRVMPVTPSEFFLVLFRNIARQVDQLRNSSTTVDDALFRRETDHVTSGLGAHARDVIRVLERSNGGARYALFATLNEDYGRYLYGVWRLQTEYESDLSPVSCGALTELRRSLEQVEVARRHFKTVFIQSELATLTRLLLYIGIPVQVGTVLLMLLFTAPAGPTVPGVALAVVIPVILTAGFAPIALLTAFIIRLATVAGRTSMEFPFSGDAETEA